MRQRQSPGHWMAAWVCVVMMGWGAGAPGEEGCALAGARYDLPGIPTTLVEAHGRLVVSMGPRGLAVIDPSDQERREVAHYREYWSLATTELPDGGLLMAGRDHRIRVAQMDESGTGLGVRLEWPAEGIPTGIAWREGLVAVAAGGAGISLYCWVDSEEPATLCGRYPFAGYARDAVFLTETLLLAADSHTAGMWVLDVSDPHRPRRVVHYPVRSYCDSVSTNGRDIFFSDRGYGFYRFEAGADGAMRSAGFISPVSEWTDRNHAQRVVIGENELAAIFRTDGALVHTRASGVHPWRLRNQVTVEGEAIDGVMMECGCLAVATMMPDAVHVVSLAADGSGE